MSFIQKGYFDNLELEVPLVWVCFNAELKPKYSTCGLSLAFFCLRRSMFSKVVLGYIENANQNQ